MVETLTLYFSTSLVFIYLSLLLLRLLDQNHRLNFVPRPIVQYPISLS